MVQKSKSQKSKVIVDIGKDRLVDITAYFEESNIIHFRPTEEQATAISTYKLSNKIQKAKEDYYKDGTSKLNDWEYDALEDSLRAINPDAPILQQVGY